MKRLALAFCLLATQAFAETAAPQQPPVDPNKPITITLPAQDLQAVVNAISDSARVSARDANRIVQSIVSQAQPQIAPQAPPKK